MSPQAPDPWERQPYDTEDSWPIFLAYRDQTPPRRGVLSMLQTRRHDPIKIARWAREHFWRERAAEFDRHLDEIRIRTREAALAQSSQEVAAEHMAILSRLRDVATQEAEKLLATVRESDGEVLRTRDLIRLVEGVTKLDRLVRGESTERVDVEGPDLGGVSDEDLERAAALLRGKGAP